LARRSHRIADEFFLLGVLDHHTAVPALDQYEGIDFGIDIAAYVALHETEPRLVVDRNDLDLAGAGIFQILGGVLDFHLLLFEDFEVIVRDRRTRHLRRCGQSPTQRKDRTQPPKTSHLSAQRQHGEYSPIPRITARAFRLRGD
tara:strand:- start:2250 stop:2681 length:432 start_codon:yes stop_codon:yes gene_type:complete